MKGGPPATFAGLYSVLPTGEVAGVRVIGIPGALTPTSTPALLAPLLTDPTGRSLCCVPGDAPGWSCEAASVTLPRLDATACGPFPARVGHAVVVLGPREQAHGAAIAARVERWRGRDHPALPALAASHDDAANAAGVQCLRPGFVIWYAPLADARELLDAIRDVILGCVAARVRVAGGPTDVDTAIRDLGFWLYRAARCDADVALAAVLLQRSGSRRAGSLLRTIPGGPSAQAAAFAAAENRFVALARVG